MINDDGWSDVEEPTPPRWIRVIVYVGPNRQRSVVVRTSVIQILLSPD